VVALIEELVASTGCERKKKPLTGKKKEKLVWWFLSSVRGWVGKGG